MATSAKSALKKDEIKFLKNKLMTEEIRIIETQKEKRTENVPVAEEYKDEVDSANEDLLIATNLRFFNREVFYLKKIKKALKKIETNEYGLCEECGDHINFQRLKARPTSEMCIVCKEESERMEAQNAHARVSKSAGKKIDLVTTL